MNDIFAQAANTTIDPFEARLAAIQIPSLVFIGALMVLGLFIEFDNWRRARKKRA